MNYIQDKYLDSDDHVIKMYKKHPLFLVLRWIWGVLGFWLLLIPTIKAIAATIEYCSTEYCLTERRVIEKYGLFNTRVNEMELSKIENITLEKGVMGGMFGFGNIIVQGSNRNHITLRCVKNPEQIRKELKAFIGIV